MEYIEDLEDDFNDIIEDIKQNNLSRNKFPKLIIGTGLSIVYKIPGMEKLAKELDNNFIEISDYEIKCIWQKRKDKIFKLGLEAGLETINLSNEKEKEFVREVKKITTKFILKKEIDIIDDIYNAKTGFKTLMSYLKNSISCNKTFIDIMTLNYDRIIEIVCDSIDLNVSTGFKGNIVKKFNESYIRSIDSKLFDVRLFKPHGSLNWIERTSSVIETNDNLRLLNNIDNIHIITPGSSKYEMCITNYLFNSMRENFCELLNKSINYSLFIFGYGFNDEHFNVILYSKFEEVPTIIISKYVKSEVIQMALHNSKLTILYEENGDNYMIYKKKKYLTRNSLWDINVFADLMFN